MARVQARTYVYGQEPAADLANWSGGTDIDGLFSAGPSLNALEVRQHMAYQLASGRKPEGRGQFLPPVTALSRQIGLR
jgi:hypothetical protein